MERISLKKTLTQKQLERLLDVSTMTVYLWRHRQSDPLPCRTFPTEGGRHRNIFLLFEVQEWVTRNRPKLATRLGGKGGDNDQSIINRESGRNLFVEPERIAS